MKESIGYTVTLNIVIVFISIIVAFFCAALIYFRSNKVSNVITSAIEKYEGYSNSAISEISSKLRSLGYASQPIDCDLSVSAEDTIVLDGDGKIIDEDKCNIVLDDNGKGSNGYCVYECYETNREYYYYKIRTNMMFVFPILRDVMDIPIYSNTNRLYDFAHKING